MKLWLDDRRPAPDTTWKVAKTSKDAIAWLVMAHKAGIQLDEVSLDHDLGGDDNGFKVLNYMIQWDDWPKELTIHTSNPPERKRMLAAANAEAPDWVEISVITDHLRRDA